MTSRRDICVWLTAAAIASASVLVTRCASAEAPAAGGDAVGTAATAARPGSVQPASPALAPTQPDDAAAHRAAPGKGSCRGLVAADSTGAPCDGQTTSGGKPAAHGGPPAVDTFGLFGAHAERLGLSADTKSAIRKIVDDSRRTAQDLRAQLDRERGRMHELMTSADVDEDAVMRQADALGALELADHKNRLRAMLQIRALLTPAQRTELMKIREEMFARAFKRTGRACDPDVKKLCPQAHGHPEAHDCIRRHRDELSPRCREALAATFLRKPSQPPHRWPPPPAP